MVEIRKIITLKIKCILYYLRIKRDMGFCDMEIVKNMIFFFSQKTLTDDNKQSSTIDSPV